MRREATPTESPETDLEGGEFSTFAREEAEDRRVLRRSLWGAAGIHLLLLLVTFPTVTSEPQVVEKEKPRIRLVPTPRFKPPPPPVEEPVRQPRALRVPMPDPTPDDPEPIRVDEPEPVDLSDDLDADFLTIPTAPPPFGPVGPIQVGGDVRKPEKIDTPQPRYTEAARRTGIEGLVIVQAIIDKEGNVTSVRVLKPLPMGLSEEAVKAIKRWKFKPATLNGKPVEVYFNLTVNFQLQR